MLNEESRKYFTRAVPVSGSPYSYFALKTEDHLQRMYDCSKTTDQKSLVEYLKTASLEEIQQCKWETSWGNTINPKWVPTIEKPDAKMAFITQSPDDIYNSDNAPVMDVLFSFSNNVCCRIYIESINGSNNTHIYRKQLYSIINYLI